MYKSILNKIDLGIECDENEYIPLLDHLVERLGKQLGVSLKYDVQPLTNPNAIRCIGYSDPPLFGAVEISILANIVVQSDYANCDIMVYSNGSRLDKNYDSGSYVQFVYGFESTKKWVCKGWFADEHGDYDSFREIHENES